MQRRLNQLLLIIAISIFMIVSCKKVIGPSGSGVTALTVVNAVVGSSGLITDINNQLPYYLGQPTVNYGSYKLYRVIGGDKSIDIRQATDTTKSLYRKGSVDLAADKVYSLFLSGSVDAPDSLLVEDHLPAHGTGIHGTTDSTAGIRFVNLSAGSSPISINIQGQPNGSEVSSLAYKAIADFKNYDATSIISSYTFEFRDASTGDLLSTYTLTGVNNGSVNTAINTVRFKNLTIVLQGLPDSQSAFRVNNF